MASESLKLSDPSDGNRGDDAAVGRGDVDVDIGIVDKGADSSSINNS